MQQFFVRGEIAAAWNEFHVPLIAVGVSAVLTVAGSRMRWPLLTLLAGGGAVLVGWWFSVRPVFPLAPHTTVQRLVMVAGAGLIVAAVAERFAARRGTWPPLILTALLSAWWMAGAPRSLHGIAAVAPVEVLALVAVVAFGWLSALNTGVAEPVRPWLGAATLAIALRVVGAPSVLVLLALTPAAALLPLLVSRTLPAMALVPLAVDVATVQVAASLVTGRLPKGGLGAVDAAALSPFLALRLYPHATARLGRFGRAAPWLGVLISGGVAVGAAWAAMRLRW